MATAFLVLSVLLLNACLAEPSEAEQALFDSVVSGWHIVVQKATVQSSMENATVELGYADVEVSEFAQDAPEGKSYCLVLLCMEKAGSREIIEWDKLTLTDGQGREYRRIEDGFIEELGMRRMPGTALNFGISEGWIAFEIDADATGLTLAYPFEETAFLCELAI